MRFRHPIWAWSPSVMVILACCSVRDIAQDLWVSRNTARKVTRSPFENVAAVAMAFIVEVVVNRGVGGNKFLHGLDVPEPGHCPFLSPKGLM